MDVNGIGVDVGTNMLVSARVNTEGKPMFKMARDAFYRIVPKSDVNRNSIRKAIEKRGFNFIEDSDGSFVVVGEEALETAIERNDVAKRPLRRGVISPKEKDSLPMLKLLLESLIGKGDGETKLVYSVPAKPIDGDFDIVYHTEMMGTYLRGMGYSAQPINEAFAIALSELLDEGLTGICLSFGAGMVNTSVIHQGDPLVEFSTTKAGDFIDMSVGNALDISPSIVQLEKESGVDLDKHTSKIMEAVSVYYNSVIEYTIRNIAYELKQREKSLPIFREEVSLVVSGGLTLAKGFNNRIRTILNKVDFPIKIGDVRKAVDPMTAVANGALLAARL
jgi:actin-like ATPase involved in cell morphogenesis